VGRRLLAEFTGAGLLVTVIVGSGVATTRLTTASTVFANPAVTIGRTLTCTYAWIAPASAPAFFAAQLVGGGPVPAKL